MAFQIQLRRGTGAAWTAADPTLAEGEVGYETDTERIKIGDGASTWSALDYWSPSVSAAGITFTPTGDISATNIAAALAELDSEKVGEAESPAAGQVSGTFTLGFTVADSHGTTGTLTHHAQSHTHSGDGSGAVAASAITFSPTGQVAATTVQTAIAEVDSEKVALTASPTGGQVSGSFSGGLTVANTHGASGVQTHHAQSHDHSLAADGTVPAANITFAPTGTVAATTVQTAIAEVASEAVQSATHIDTDSATTSLHHTIGTGATQAAAGNHTHPASGLPVLYTTSDQSVTTSTALVTVTAFNIAVAPNAVLALEYWVPLITGAGGFKVGWSLPAGGATLTWTTADGTAGSTTTTGAAVPVASTTAVQWVRVRAYYVGGSQSGTVSFQYAQNTSSGTSTVVKKGAWLTYINQ